MREDFDNDVERLMARRLDGDLPREDVERLDALLQTDARARQEFDALERVDRLVRAWGAKEPDVDWGAFHRDVADRIRQNARPRRYEASYRVIRIGVPLAAAAAVAAAFLLLWPSSPKPVRPHPGPTLHPVVQVAYARPAAKAQPGNRTIRVNYSRSPEVTERIAASDAEPRPSWALAVPSKPNVASALRSMGQFPPI